MMNTAFLQQQIGTHMKTKYILKKTLVIASLLLTSFFFSANPVVAQSDKVTWEFAQHWSGKSLLGYPTYRLAEIVDSISGGNFEIKLIDKKAHGNTKAIFDFVKEGKYDMGHSASNFWKKKDQDTVFFSAVPFGMVTPELYSWFYEGGGLELMNKVYNKHGIMAFPGGNSGHQMIGWFNREIRTVEDLKGLKMRLPGLAGQVMEGLGVEIINPPVSELKEALATKKLDAVELVGPAIDLGLGFPEVSKYYYVGWHSPSSEMMFMVNPDSYKKLSKKNQFILKTAMRLAAYDTFTKIVSENGKKMQSLLTDFPKLQIRSLPNKVLRALKQEHARLTTELADKSPDGLTRQIIDSMQQHLEQQRLWTRFSDLAYLSNAGGL